MKRIFIVLLLGVNLFVVLALFSVTFNNANVSVIIEEPLYMDTYSYESGEGDYEPTFIVDIKTNIPGIDVFYENSEILKLNNVTEENVYVSSTIKSIRFYFQELDEAINFSSKYNWDENVQRIYIYQYYYPITEMAPGGGINIDDGGGSDCNSSTNTAGKIKVGIVDSGNISRLDNSDLCNVIVIEEFPSATQRNHITDIANIIIDEVGGIDDIAFVTTVDSSYENSDLLARLDYLDSKNVDVINLSIGTGTPANVGNYTSVAVTVDEFIYSTDIPIVAAAGNRQYTWDDNYVVSPSIGFNVISVGSTDEHGDWYQTSSYVESTTTTYVVASSNAPQKPNVVANAKHLVEDIYGTSYATPRVVGKIVKCIKSTYCSDYTDGNKAEFFMSWVQSNTLKSDPQYNPDSSGFDDKIGAGYIKLASLNNSIVVKTPFELESGFSLSIPLNSSITTDISMSYSIEDVNQVLREYKIDVYNDDSELVGTYYMINNSVCFELPIGSGNYTLILTSTSNDPHNGGNLVIVSTP